MDNLIRIYVNHRPVYGISKKQILDAIVTLTGKKSIDRNEFIELLTNKGEFMNEKELRKCILMLLLQDTEEDELIQLEELIPEEVTVDWITETLLGFEDIEEKEK